MKKTQRLSSLLAIFLLASGYVSAQSGNITFADAAVKAICVANWDTNGDGLMRLPVVSVPLKVSTFQLFQAMSISVSRRSSLIS